MAKITIVVPVYNVEKYISRCIDSILAQTFSDFELILVDDGSPDNCGKICEEYAGKDDRVRVLHRENGGLSAARNSGIDWSLNNSDSEWITFIDSDDWVHNEYLSALYKAVTSTRLSVAVCDFCKTHGEPLSTNNALNFDVLSPEKLYLENYVQFITAWGKLYKKDCFKELRYPIGKLHEDEFVTWKVLFECDKIAVVNQPLYAYFINDTGIIRSEWSLKRLSALDAFEERLIYFNKVGKFPKARANLIEHYRWHLLDSIKQVREKYPERKDIRRSLLKRLRRFLKQADYSIFNYSGLYEMAYPKTFKYMWAIALRFGKKG